MTDYIIGNTTNIEIPGIKSYNTSYEKLSQESRTIGCSLKIINITGNKRIIEISTIPIDKHQALALENYLRTTSGFTHLVYLDVLQATIECVIEFSSNKELDSNGKYTIKLVLKEV